MNTTYAARIAKRNEHRRIAKAAEAAGEWSTAATHWDFVAHLEDRRVGNAALAYAEGKATDCEALARAALRASR